VRAWVRVRAATGCACILGVLGAFIGVRVRAVAWGIVSKINGLQRILNVLDYI
tara:strand:+ start:8951 stop:9109 length:159 start_codon:yes stop_codon:yes gene_type:complete